MRHHRKAAALLLALSLTVTFGGCDKKEEAVPAAALEDAAASEAAAQTDSSSAGQEASFVADMEQAAQKRGGGTFIFGTVEEEGAPSQKEPDLEEAQVQLMLDYMDLYYESLARLEPGDPSGLFAVGREDQALGNEAVWTYLIETRKLQRADLTLDSYEYTLTFRRMEESETDGSVTVMVREDNIQHFSACPEIDSQCFDVYHSFSMIKTEEGWRLTSHMQLDSLYYIVFLKNTVSDRSMYRQRSFDTQGEDPKTYFSRLLQELLDGAERDIAARGFGETQLLQADHPYNRQAAVEYAMEWVEQRNEEWPDYGIYGGNCQNYVSQCLLAGGIPMDPYGPYVWKWYGDTPNNASGMAGRSASWSGVEQFREYAQGNSGFGLVSQVDAPYYSGEAGDLLELGPEDIWKHTVLIVDVLKNDAGETVDYLVNSNTANLCNFPAGAYSYSRQSLVKIAGWND